MAAHVELRVRSAKLEGFLPFPTWNGTIAAPSMTHADSAAWLCVQKVLPPAVEKPSSFCQCWTNDGAVVATAHDRSVVLYSSDDFKVLARLRLRYSVTSIDITKRCQGDTSEFLLIVGTSFGCFLYSVLLGSEWQMLPSCKDLSANPKPKAGVTAGVNKTATAAQTLVVCWGPVLVVCSRAVASRVELYDFESGSLLHTLQLVPATPNAPAAALNQWLDQQLVTGVCSAQVTSPSGYSSRLLCHDTSANIAVVEWPFLDVIVQRRR
ncbi:WD40-repeat-containing domain [Phytophthora cactorum]|nr:WD40-repeat-containing domain [Phytophthora cactorum]